MAIHPTVPGGYVVVEANAEGKLVDKFPLEIFYTYLDADGNARWCHRVVGGEILGEGRLEKNGATFDLILDNGQIYGFGAYPPLQFRVDIGSRWVQLRPI